ELPAEKRPDVKCGVRTERAPIGQIHDERDGIGNRTTGICPLAVVAQAHYDFQGSVTMSVAGGRHDQELPIDDLGFTVDVDVVRARAGVRLLDVACGPGFITAAAAARGADPIGLDFSPAMIALARRLHPSIAFRDGDAEALPFDDRSFDAVVMNFGLLHLAR